MLDKVAIRLTIAFAIGMAGGTCLVQGVPPPVAQITADCAGPVCATNLHAPDAQLLRFRFMAKGKVAR